jgi:hypothetical protein
MKTIQLSYPAILSVTHEEDKQMRINGYSHQEIRRYRAARMLKEAYAQKGRKSLKLLE